MGTVQNLAFIWSLLVLSFSPQPLLTLCIGISDTKRPENCSCLLLYAPSSRIGWGPSASLGGTLNKSFTHRSKVVTDVKISVLKSGTVERADIVFPAAWQADTHLVSRFYLHRHQAGLWVWNSCLCVPCLWSQLHLLAATVNMEWNSCSSRLGGWIKHSLGRSCQPVAALAANVILLLPVAHPSHGCAGYPAASSRGASSPIPAGRQAASEGGSTCRLAETRVMWAI